MQQNNYEYLLKQLKYTGFKEELTEVLKTNLQSDANSFNIQHHIKFGQDEVKATLNFHRSGADAMCFFNNYILELQKGSNAEALKQKFYISSKEDNITLKEGYNLLDGRAVYKELTPKEGPTYNAWVQLDFKQTDANGNYERKTFHQNYGYDLQATLAKHPILELNDEKTKKMLMESLERGNRQSVTYKPGDQEQKVFVEAAPQFKSLNFYGMDMHRLKPEQLQPAPAPSQEEDKKQKQGQKQKLTKEDGKPKTKKRNQGKRAGVS